MLFELLFILYTELLDVLQPNRLLALLYIAWLWACDKWWGRLGGKAEGSYDIIDNWVFYHHFLMMGLTLDRGSRFDKSAHHDVDADDLLLSSRQIKKMKICIEEVYIFHILCFGPILKLSLRFPFISISAILYLFFLFFHLPLQNHSFYHYLCLRNKHD